MTINTEMVFYWLPSHTNILKMAAGLRNSELVAELLKYKDARKIEVLTTMNIPICDYTIEELKQESYLKKKFLDLEILEPGKSLFINARWHFYRLKKRKAIDGGVSPYNDQERLEYSILEHGPVTEARKHEHTTTREHPEDEDSEWDEDESESENEEEWYSSGSNTKLELRLKFGTIREIIELIQRVFRGSKLGGTDYTWPMLFMGLSPTDGGYEPIFFGDKEDCDEQMLLAPYREILGYLKKLNTHSFSTASLIVEKIQDRVKGGANGYTYFAPLLCDEAIDAFDRIYGKDNMYSVALLVCLVQLNQCEARQDTVKVLLHKAYARYLRIVNPRQGLSEKAVEGLRNSLGALCAKYSNWKHSRRRYSDWRIYGLLMISIQKLENRVDSNSAKRRKIQ